MRLGHNILLVTQKRLEHDSCDLKDQKEENGTKKPSPRVSTNDFCRSTLNIIPGQILFHVWYGTYQ